MPAKAKLPPGKGKRVPLNMRTTTEMRARIEQAAADSGRSLVQEVEHRVEQSFEKERRETEIAAQAAYGVYSSFGSFGAYQVFRWLADAIALMEREKESGTWLKNQADFEEVRKALNFCLEMIKPKGSVGSIPSGLLAELAIEREAEHLGTGAAAQVIKEWQERLMLVDILMSSATSKSED